MSLVLSSYNYVKGTRSRLFSAKAENMELKCYILFVFGLGTTLDGTQDLLLVLS